MLYDPNYDSKMTVRNPGMKKSHPFAGWDFYL
jgi:hypothetical protein